MTSHDRPDWTDVATFYRAKIELEEVEPYIDGNGYRREHTTTISHHTVTGTTPADAMVQACAHTDSLYEWHAAQVEDDTPPAPPLTPGEVNARISAAFSQLSKATQNMLRPNPRPANPDERAAEANRDSTNEDEDRAEESIHRCTFCLGIVHFNNDGDWYHEDRSRKNHEATPPDDDQPCPQCGNRGPHTARQCADSGVTLDGMRHLDRASTKPLDVAASIDPYAIPANRIPDAEPDHTEAHTTSIC